MGRCKPDTPDNGQEPPEPCETAAMTDKIEAATTAMQEANGINFTPAPIARAE